jgi:glycosyltransferase involved in cell wall biosynthesis
MHSPGFVAPVIMPCRNIVTIHDLFHLRFPQWISPAKRAYWNALIPLTLRGAWRVITPSKTIRDEVLQTYPFVREKIVVTYEGTKFAENPKPVPLSLESVGLRKINPYFFWVGTFAHHKNLITLVRAFDLFKQRTGSNYRLVLAGAVGDTISSSLDEIKNAIKLQGLESEVVFLGRVDDKQLESLYENAASVVFPSLYEGFGLPVVEAMSLGCPVIVSSSGSLPEIAGDAAHVIENATDPTAFAAAMEKIVSDRNYREGLVAKGYDRSRQFSFARMAQETLACYLNAKI